MKRFLITLMSLFVCAAALAADLMKFKSWPDSPEGYFMTKAEREQWRALTNDEEAEKFIADFTARRKDGFAAEVAKRAEMADKYLTIGKVKGSQSFRGRLIVLFGAPADMQVADRTASSNYASGSAPTGVTDLGSGVSSVGGGDGGSQRMGGKTAGRSFRDYTFTFSAKNVPALGGKDLVVVVETDTVTGKDRLKEAKELENLEAKFEVVAQSMIR